MAFSKKRKAELRKLESDNTKYCIRCKKIKPLFEFSVHVTGHKFANSYCLECVKAESKERHLQAKYNISLLDYDKLLEKQNGKCKICRTKETGNKRQSRFCIDHDHMTGKIRGLLCSSCNKLLGDAKDDIKILAAAIQYLIDSSKS